jgi:peptidoglycan/LPS O-acetylase OafA/YrhL
VSTRLSEVAQGRNNNFNLLRFLAAAMVIWTHSCVLSPGGDEPLSQQIGMSLGDIGVDIFFVTSGFLIANSFFSGKGWLEFAWARILRIYPALWFAVMVCVLVGAYFTTLSVTEYLSSGQTWRYVLGNGIMWFGDQPHLPGVFLTTPFGGWVNGSMWTLPHELHLYALLALLGGIFMASGRLLGKPVVRVGMLSLAVVLLVLVTINHHHSILPDGHSRAYRLFAMFFAGVSAYVWRKKVWLSTSLAVVMLVLMAVLFVYFETSARAFYGVALPYLVLYFAYVPGGGIIHFNRLGDYSYGLYIYHWPLMQSLVSLHPDIDAMWMLLFGLGLALLAAVLSWHLLEKKCLSFKVILRPVVEGGDRSGRENRIHAARRIKENQI